jgi:nitroreductase
MARRADEPQPKEKTEMANSATAVLQQLHTDRFSCRAFLHDPVPRKTQEELLALAQRTASWCNAQSWQVHITEGHGTERFRTAMLAPAHPDEAGPDFEWPQEYRGVYKERRWDCAMALYESVGIARGDREASAAQARENFRFFGAPHVAMITTDAGLGCYGAVDCGGFVANFLLAAASLGIATIAQAALASRPQRVRDFFGLPPDRKVVCGISFGYADAAHPANSFRTTRAPLEAVASWRVD